MGLLREKLHFVSPLRFHMQRNSDQESSKIMLQLLRASKRYLNQKNLMHGRETATISKSSAHYFGKYTLRICGRNIIFLKLDKFFLEEGRK